MRSVDLIDKCAQKANDASKFLEDRNYDSFQKHGQRISVHRTMRTDENDDGVKEVFIGKIPRDLFEDELLPKLEKAGRVRKMRLMMDFSGTNRGYAYAEFITSAEARQAVKILSGTQIRTNEFHPIAVLPSFDNKKLYLGNLPVKTNKHELRQELDKLVDGIDHVDLVDCAHGASSRLALVTFESHDAATGARRILCPGSVSICDRKVTVEWAKPQKPYDTSPQKSSSLSSATSSSSSSSKSSFECAKSSSSFKGAKSSSSFEGAKPSSRPSPPPQLNPELVKLLQSIGDIVISSSDKRSRNGGGGVTNPSWAHQQQQHDQQQKRQQQQQQQQHQQQQQQQYKRQLFHQFHQRAQPQHHLQHRRYQHQQPNQKVHFQRQQNYNQYRQLKLNQIQHLTTHLHQQHQLQLQTHQQPPLLHQQHQLHQQHPQIPSIPGQLDKHHLDLLDNAIKIFQTGGIEKLTGVPVPPLLHQI